jgi:alpha-beta hydrolase superfamily lysophospholipase
MWFASIDRCVDYEWSPRCVKRITVRCGASDRPEKIQIPEWRYTPFPVKSPALHHVVTRLTAPRAVVGILHGYADHAARYAHVMDAWAGHGIASVALDMRGHGRSEGARGACTRFDDYLEDAAELARLVAEVAPGCPGFLFGHSFGALVAVHSVTRAPRAWKGLLLSSPYIALAKTVPWPKILAGQLASRLVPGFSLPAGITGADVTRDPEKARGYETDPLVFKRATARWFTETRAAQPRALALARSLLLPLLVVAGGADPVADVRAGRALFAAADSADKTWDERPGLRHEVLNEPEWREIADAMARWMIERV